MRRREEERSKNSRAGEEETRRNEAAEAEDRNIFEVSLCKYGLCMYYSIYHSGLLP